MSVNISNVLAREGHDILLICSRSYGPLLKYLDSSVKCFLLKKRNAIDLIAFARFHQLIKEFEPDFIHAHSSSINWCLILKNFFSFNFKLIFHDHYGLSEQVRDKDRWFLRQYSKNIDFCIAVNTKLAEWSKRNLLINSKNVVVIHNFPLLPSRKEITSERKSHTTIVCLANFRPQKDHITLIKAIDSLIKMPKLIPFKLLLIGEISDKVYFSNVVLEIQNRNLSEYINILGPIEDVSDILFSSDIGILSSNSEGLPVSLLEYGLAGLPVVVTNVGQCSEVIVNGDLGKLVNPNDFELMAEAIYSLISNPDFGVEMGLQFRKHIYKNFGSQKFLEQYYNLLEVNV